MPQLEDDLRRLRAVSASRLAILVRGESGTGKELAASAVHALSGRAGALVAVNCGALPEQLIASELFGYKKGAFSGALEERAGLVRGADRGTLFLDEIGDLRLESQTALLRVLQEGEVLPLGGARPVKVDVRVVAATHRDLEAMVKQGDFRQDLLSRLSGHTVRLPPLRERLPDLGLLLAGIFLRRLPERASSLTLGQAGARALFASRWPLNVRELERAVVAAAALSPEAQLDLRQALAAPAEGPAAAAGDEADLRERLQALLTAHKGNVSAVASEMGKARMQVQRWMKRFGFDPESYR
jgi:transcriptional regulator with GAF, ATPase, and Fis domain